LHPAYPSLSDRVIQADGQVGFGWVIESNSLFFGFNFQKKLTAKADFLILIQSPP